MATTEDSIRKAVILLLEQYGDLNTTEVKQLLQNVLPFDSDDNEDSNSRNEPKILQRIGNVVSHQNEPKRCYYNAYEIDKNQHPAVWKPLVGLKSNETRRTADRDYLNKKKNLVTKFRPKKIDWDSVSKNRSEIGLLGEEFIMRYETNRVLNFAPEDLERIIHLSKEQGDGSGFDILSINEDGTTRYIEVKTSIYNRDSPFYMSINEKSFFEAHRNEDDAFIYRIYNYNKSKGTGLVNIITAHDLLNNYNFDPVSFEVKLKP